jgi:predicted secreted hydrolase
LTIFRFSLTAQAPKPRQSAWQTNQVFIGHLAVTDADNRRFHVAQRYSRGAAGLAGATASPVRIWLDDWSISADGNRHWQLRASDEDFGIALDLEPLKPVVLNGDRGLSQKSAEPGNASYYYSVPRLATRGVITVDGADVEVSGLSWLDREWGSSALARDQRGWDWFALQLSDGSDLMYYVLRGPGDVPDPHSSGTRIDAAGTAMGLGLDDVSINVTDYWESERGGRYPSGWEIEVPGEALSLRVTPILDDQELVTNVRYWEGAVDVVGTSKGLPIRGRGYVELTGYASD